MTTLRRPWRAVYANSHSKIMDAKGMIVLRTVEYSGLDHAKLAGEVAALANARGKLNEELRDRIVTVLRNPRLKEVEEARALLEELTT